VDGKLHGARVRRNFRMKEEEAAEKGSLELKAMQPASGLRPAVCATIFRAAARGWFRDKG